jgi:hypothetical protein
MSIETVERISKLLRDRAVIRSQMDINQSTSSTALWGIFHSKVEFVEYVKSFDSTTVAHAFTLAFAEMHNRVLKLSEYKSYIGAVERALLRLEYVRDFKRELSQKKTKHRAIGDKTPARIRNAHKMWMQMRQTGAKKIDWEKSGLADVGLKGEKKNPIGSPQRGKQLKALRRNVQALDYRVKNSKVT